MQPRKHENTKKIQFLLCFVFVSFVFTPQAAVSQAAQQPPQPTFRTGTRLIVETVTVKDKEGKPIEGLTAKDFTITEDGDPQTISFVEFQRVDAAAAPADSPVAPSPATPAPLPAAASPAVQPTIAGSAPGDIKYRNRRLLVLYFDVTALPPADLLRACAAAQTFVDTQMTPADLVAITAFSGGAVRV